MSSEAEVMQNEQTGGPSGAGWLLAKRSIDIPPAEPVVDAGQRTVPRKEQVHLYFGDDQGRFLKAEPRVMDLPEDAVRRSRRLIESLLSGPRSGGSRIGTTQSR